MDVNNSGLNSPLRYGASIRAILMNLPLEASDKPTKIFPVIADKADMPYIVYRRVQLESSPIKGFNQRSSLYPVFEVDIYTESYAQGVRIGEAVIEALDNVSYTPDDEGGGAPFSRCTLSGAGEED